MQRSRNAEEVYSSLSDKIQAENALLCLKIDANQQKTNEAIKHNEVMLEKMTEAFERRLKELNGIRETFREHTLTSIPREEAQAKFEALGAKQEAAFKSQQEKIDELGGRLDRSRLPNYQNWIGFFSIVVGLSTLGWLLLNLQITNITGPLLADMRSEQTQLADNDNRVRKVENDSLSSIQADIASRGDRGQLNERVKVVESSMSEGQSDRKAKEASFSASLSEIEGQICSQDDTRNLMHADDLRVMSMLWQHSHLGRYPTDNAFYPQICNKGLYPIR